MCVSRVRLLQTPWTVAHQPPLSVEFSGKNTGEGSHFLLQGSFLTQGSHFRSPALQADSLSSESPCTLELSFISADDGEFELE